VQGTNDEITPTSGINKVLFDADESQSHLLWKSLTNFSRALSVSPTCFVTAIAQDVLQDQK